jgi:hypothetical protein
VSESLPGLLLTEVLPVDELADELLPDEELPDEVTAAMPKVERPWGDLAVKKSVEPVLLV